jgi:dUTP pyrophosphatase
MQFIQFKRLRTSANLSKGYPEDNGYDITASLAQSPIYIDPGRWIIIPTGIVLKLPLGSFAQVVPRSGIALKHGVTVLNSPGTIDSGYRGEIKVILINHGPRRFYVNDGDRIAQIIFAKPDDASLMEVKLEPGDEPTARGSQGFGSSGTN